MVDIGLGGKSVLVTGGASNIGRAIVFALAREDANIVFADIDEEQAQRTLKDAAKQGKGRVSFQAADVTKEEDVDALIGRTMTEHGRLDVLINNVGWDRPSAFVRQSTKHWRQLIEVNLVSTILCTQAALPRLVDAGGGAIVSVSSDASFGEPRETVYGAAKAGVNTFMKAIAKEYGRHGIRCNVVAPGLILPTAAEEIGANSLWVGRDAFFSDEQVEKARRAIPLGKVGRAADIANAVLFFASPGMAGHISGQVLSVSGGYATPG
jgi:2-hydroxycyclohexanecarboxyl-CoA dehydrogenase